MRKHGKKPGIVYREEDSGLWVGCCKDCPFQAVMQDWHGAMYMANRHAREPDLGRFVLLLDLIHAETWHV